MKSIDTAKEDVVISKYFKILDILSKIPEDKLDRLVDFLSKFDFDEDKISGKRDTITYDRDLRIKILGEVDMKSQKDFFITSNHTVKNPKTGDPFSVRFNDSLSKTIQEEDE